MKRNNAWSFQRHAQRSAHDVHTIEQVSKRSQFIQVESVWIHTAKDIYLFTLLISAHLRDVTDAAKLFEPCPSPV